MYNEALDYANRSNCDHVKAKAFHGLALIESARNNFQNSIVDHHKAISILDRIGAKPDLAEVYFQLGLTYQARKEHVLAEKYKAEALKIFAQMKAPKQIERVDKAFRENVQ